MSKRFPTTNKSKGTRYTDAEKKQAVNLYLVLGSIYAVSRELGIHETTLTLWKQTDWWKDYEYDLQHEGRIKLTKNLEKVRDKAISVVEDRLVNGDFVVVHTRGGHEVIRKPVSIKDANTVAKDTINQTIAIDKIEKDSKALTTNERIADRLLMIFDKFKALGSKKTTEPQSIIEGELVSNERESEQHAQHEGIEGRLGLEQREASEPGVSDVRSRQPGRILTVDTGQSETATGSEELVSGLQQDESSRTGVGTTNG